MEIAIALIAAGAALLGTFVGGTLTARSNHRLEGERRHRDDQKDATFAKATARTLRMRYITAKRTLEGIVRDKRWWTGSITTVKDPTSEDLKVLATYLKEDEWEAIEYAEFLLARWERLRDRNVESGVPPIGIAEEDLQFALEAFDHAALALHALSHPDIARKPIGRPSG